MASGIAGAVKSCASQSVAVPHVIAMVNPPQCQTPRESVGFESAAAEVRCPYHVPPAMRAGLSEQITCPDVHSRSLQLCRFAGPACYLSCDLPDEVTIPFAVPGKRDVHDGTSAHDGA